MTLTSSVCVVSEAIKMVERWRGVERSPPNDCFHEVWPTRLPPLCCPGQRTLRFGGGWWWWVLGSHRRWHWLIKTAKTCGIFLWAPQEGGETLVRDRRRLPGLGVTTGGGLADWTRMKLGGQDGWTCRDPAPVCSSLFRMSSKNRDV